MCGEKLKPPIHTGYSGAEGTEIFLGGSFLGGWGMAGTSALKDSAQSCQLWMLRHYLKIGIFRWKSI